MIRLAIWLLEKSLAPSERDPIVGDLLEDYAALASRSRRAARLWVWRQTLQSIVPNLKRRVSGRPVSHRGAQTRGARTMHGLYADVRFALRLLRRQPLTSAVALLSLSAGLGLNTLLIVLANAVLFRPLPLHDPNRLAVLLLQRETGLNHNFSYPDYIDLRDSSTSMDALVAYGQAAATLSLTTGSKPLIGEIVSGSFFSALGVPLRTGRGLLPDDDRANAAPAVVVSERFWRDLFGHAPLNGQTVTLNGQALTIVGIAHGSFMGMQVGRRSDFWIPLSQTALTERRDYRAQRTASWLTVMGRLEDGVGMAAARHELDALMRRITETTGRPPQAIVLQPGARGDSMLPPRLRSPLLLLMGAGFLVLLVACMNAANLQLAKTDARRLELAVRAALGARRTQLARLLMVDGALLAGAAGLVGVLFAAAAKEHAASLIALFGEPVSLATPLDLRVLGAALGLSGLAAIVVAALSAWQIARRAPGEALAETRTTTSGRRTAQRVLIVTQFALSMALVTGAALLGRTLVALRTADLGFDSREVVVIETSPAMARLDSSSALAYFEEVVRRLASVPGVERVSVAHVMPLDFGGSRMTVDVAGYEPQPDEDMELNYVAVSPEYFETLGIPIVHGRAFDSRDGAGQPARIIVNETMARRFWPDGNAVGRYVRFSSEDPYEVEVVGVVPDARYRIVREQPRPSFYRSFAHAQIPRGVLHVRLGVDPESRVEELRRVVASVNPAVPVTRASTLRGQIERNIADERMAAAIGATLAAVALLLAAAGLYATMAFVVGRRTKEIGVRLALGARMRDVSALVMREGLILVGTGAVFGLGLAVWTGYALRHQLFGVDGLDAVSLAVSGALLTLAALAASWIPARRAARVDPVVALRES